MGFYKVEDRVWYLLKLRATTAQFAGNILGHVAAPAFGSVERQEPAPMKRAVKF